MIPPSIYKTLFLILLRYLILELCVGTVNDYVKGNYKGDMPSEIDGMIQMASGLQFIHSQNFVHRDIKPANVLISTSHVLKISDFGFCRPVTSSGSFSMSSGPKGTRKYNSPEFLRSEEKDQMEREQIRANVSIDIFSLGCLFCNYITMGGHPFASGNISNEFLIVANIYSGNKVLGNEGSSKQSMINNKCTSDIIYSYPFFKLGLSKEHYAFSMIDGMTEVEVNRRWRLDQVLTILESQKAKLAQDAATKN